MLCLEGIQLSIVENLRSDMDFYKILDGGEFFEYKPGIFKFYLGNT